MSTSLADHLLERLCAAALRPDPWAHAYLPDAVPTDVAAELARCVAALDLTAHEETERVKSYRFQSRELRGHDPALVPRNEALDAVVALLTGPAYRNRMSGITGLDLDDATVSVDLWEYRPGDWLAPHVDKPEKRLTQIFYLTDGWTPGDGGRLLVLGSSSVEDVHRALPPQLGSSAVLVRSAESWHAVEPPMPRSPVRRSITATFWRPSTPAARRGC